MNKILHLTLIFALLLTIVLVFKLRTVDDSPVQVVPMPVPNAMPIPHPLKKEVPMPPTVPNPGYRYLFPAPLNRLYAPGPFVWGHESVPVELALGEINTPPAPDVPLRAEPIRPGPTHVTFRWILALP